MYQQLPSYLRTFRKKRAFTQGDIARLLGGVSASAISKYESLARIPSSKALMGIEVIFQEAIREVYPKLFAEVAATILSNAEVLLTEIADLPGAVAAARRKALNDLITSLREPTPQPV